MSVLLPVAPPVAPPVMVSAARVRPPWTLLLATLLSLALLAPVAAVSSPLVSEAATRTFGRAIEWFAPVQQQSRCDPAPKPGTVKLERWLEKTYRGTGSLGISRACRSGGTSEHKEGRAFDWKVSVRNRTQKAQADAFTRFLLAKDRYGNKAAMARRMGVMYVIWNHRIWSTSQPNVWRPYRGSSEHTDHMHISLSWNGARGRTSFWSGLVVDPVPVPVPVPGKPTPKPKPPVAPTLPTVAPSARPASPPRPGTSPDPVTPPVSPTAPAPGYPPVLDQDSTPMVGLDVPAAGQPLTTSFSLRAGRTYRLVASGTYRYGTGSQLADATCNWHPYDDAGWARRSTWEQTGTSHLDLTVDGRSDWRARNGSTSACDSSRTYYWDYKPATTGPVTFGVNEDYAGDDAGSLHVSIVRAGTAPDAYAVAAPAPAPAPGGDVPVLTDGPTAYSEQVSVPASGAVAHTTAVLRAGVAYTVSAAGTVDYGEGQADAACVLRGQASVWHKSASVDPLHPGLDNLNLFAGGVVPTTTPVGTSSSGCATSTHTYTWSFVPSADQRLRLQIDDPSPSDNAGALTVTVQRSGAVVPPVADNPVVTTGSALRDETVTLAANATTPVRTEGVVVAGSTYALTVTGTYDTGYGAADAECASRGAPAVWTSDVSRWNDVRPADLFGLFVDATDPALTADDLVSGCSASHVWRGSFLARRSGKLRLSLWDVDLADNSGALVVRLVKVVPGGVPTAGPTASPSATPAPTPSASGTATPAPAAGTSAVATPAPSTSPAAGSV